MREPPDDERPDDVDFMGVSRRLTRWRANLMAIALALGAVGLAIKYHLFGF